MREDFKMKNIVLVSLFLSSFICLSAQAVEVQRDYKFCRQAIERIARGNPNDQNNADSRNNKVGYEIPFDFIKDTDAMVGGKESPSKNPKVYERILPGEEGLEPKVTLKTTVKDGILAQYEIEHLDQCKKAMFGGPDCRKRQLIFNVEVHPITNVCYFKDITFYNTEGGVKNITYSIMTEKVCDYLQTHQGEPGNTIEAKFESDPENKDGKWKERFNLKYYNGKTGSSKLGRMVRDLNTRCNSYVQGYTERGANSDKLTAPVQKKSAK